MGHRSEEEHHYKFALLGTDGGAYWIYTSPENSFYFNIISDSIFATGAESYFLIRDKILQASVINAEQGIPENLPTLEETQEILEDFMYHELRFLKNEQKLNIPGVEYKFIDLGRFHFMEWWYKIEGSQNSINSRTNLSVLCFEAILNLNISIKANQSLNEEKEFLREVGKSLIKVLGPVDIDKMAETIQKK